MVVGWGGEIVQRDNHCVVRVRDAPKNLTFGTKICNIWWKFVIIGFGIGTTRVRERKKRMNN